MESNFCLKEEEFLSAFFPLHLRVTAMYADEKSFHATLESAKLFHYAARNAMKSRKDDTELCVFLFALQQFPWLHSAFFSSKIMAIYSHLDSSAILAAESACLCKYWSIVCAPRFNSCSRRLILLVFSLLITWIEILSINVCTSNEIKRCDVCMSLELFSVFKIKFKLLWKQPMIISRKEISQKYSP